MDPESDKPAEGVPSRRRVSQLATRNALIGATFGALMGCTVTYAPNSYVLWGRDITPIVGLAEFTLIWAALGASIELIPALVDRIFSRKE